MKKLTMTLLALIAIAVVMIMTCPDAEAHKNAFKEAANQAVTNELSTVGDNAGLTQLLGGVIGNYFVDNIVDSRMFVKNYFVCSVGFLNSLDGSEPQLVTVGLFNHVFSPTAEQIRESIDQ